MTTTNAPEADTTDVVAASVRAYSDHIDAYTAYNADAVGDASRRFLSLLRPGSAILDAGCGPGRDLARFSAAGHYPVGVDLNPDFVTEASQHAPARVGDLRDLVFADGTFDGVWACASLVHLPKPDAVTALSELARVVRPGSPVCVSVKTSGTTGWVDTAHGRRWFRIWTPAEFAEAVADAGLTICHVETGPVFTDVWASAT